jgi:hypothetical protein
MIDMMPVMVVVLVFRRINGLDYVFDIRWKICTAGVKRWCGTVFAKEQIRTNFYSACTTKTYRMQLIS